MANTITLQEAARRMGVKQCRLYARQGKKWTHFPELGRYQEKPGMTIYFLEEQVQRWIEARDQVFAEAERRYAPVALSSEKLQQVRDRGWHKVAKALEWLHGS